jgi:hypothetical protein
LRLTHATEQHELTGVLRCFLGVCPPREYRFSVRIIHNALPGPFQSKVRQCVVVVAGENADVE